MMTIKKEISKVPAGFNITRSVPPALSAVFLIILPNRKIFFMSANMRISSGDVGIKPIFILKKINTAQKSSVLRHNAICF